MCAERGSSETLLSFESPRQYQPVRQLVKAPQVPHAIAREEEVRARPPPPCDRPQIDLADLRRARDAVAVRVEVSNGTRHRYVPVSYTHLTLPTKA